MGAAHSTVPHPDRNRPIFTWHPTRPHRPRGATPSRRITLPSGVRVGVRFGATLALAAASPLEAQSRDPVAEAQSFFDTRRTATTTAGMLKREHTRTLDQSAIILRSVGFTAQALVPALRSEFTPSLSAVYGSLKQAGFASRDVSDAFTANGIALDCIDPQGYAVPCGSFGGTSDAAVTGQVTWHPKPEGKVGDLLHIEASNLPPVFVRIGSITLTEVNSSGSAVIVRLPSAPLTGHLTLTRKNDGVTGLLQKDYRVVVPPLPWSAFATAAYEGAVADMKHWMAGARIVSGCVVNAPSASAPPGSFTSANGFKGELRAKLLAAGAPTSVADAWDAAFRAAFLTYTSSVTIPGLPLYPGLVVVNASKGGPVTATPTPLAAFVGVGAISMQAGALGPAVAAAVSPISTDDPARATAISTFAVLTGGRFNLMLTKAIVLNLMGSGPVPGYAPPGAPAGPVTGGTCSGTNIVSVAPDVW